MLHGWRGPTRWRDKIIRQRVQMEPLVRRVQLFPISSLIALVRPRGHTYNRGGVSRGGVW